MWAQLRHRFVLGFLGIDLESFSGIGIACLVSPWMARGNILMYLTPGGPLLAERERLVLSLLLIKSSLHLTLHIGGRNC